MYKQTATTSIIQNILTSSGKQNKNLQMKINQNLTVALVYFLWSLDTLFSAEMFEKDEVKPKANIIIRGNNFKLQLNLCTSLIVFI
jgi:hypothetical protein